MYRKIIFISINLFQEMDLIGKTTILIFFSFISLLITFHERPFLLRRMNILEFYSNLSASLTLFLATIYISNKNEFLNGMCFILVALVNLNFGYQWLSAVINIVVLTHGPYLQKHFPNLIAYYFAVQNSLINFSFKTKKKFEKESKTNKQSIHDNIKAVKFKFITQN